MCVCVHVCVIVCVYVHVYMLTCVCVHVCVLFAMGTYSRSMVTCMVVLSWRNL